jgi:CRISPR/Cas system-associated protein Cas5 (RAMP superfamily)
LPLPPKTTVAGMIGSALGISPKEINDEWLKKDRFKMGIAGKSNGKANDLWQIRKYETKQIAAYNKGTETAPYKTAVIVRELLYSSDYLIYLSFANKDDNNRILEKLNHPEWALSLGREDELIRITEVKNIEINEREDIAYSNTILPFDINTDGYTITLNGLSEGNILDEAPKIVRLPVTFSHKTNSEVREADSFQLFSFISSLPIKPSINKGFYDPEESCAFQIF